MEIKTSSRLAFRHTILRRLIQLSYSNTAEMEREVGCPPESQHLNIKNDTNNN